MLRVLLRVVADAVIVAVVMFGAAGTLAWPRAWVLVGVLLLVRLPSAFAVFRASPALLRKRSTVLVHRGQPWADRVVLLAFMATAFIGVPAVAALHALLPLALLMLRIGLEERVLRRELPGYPEFMARAPYRVLPGIW